MINMVDSQSQSTINVIVETPVINSQINQDTHINHNLMAAKSVPPPLSSISPPQPPSNLSLRKVHAGYFRICISLVSQALLWKALIISEHTKYPKSLLIINGHAFPSITFLLLWYLSLSSLLLLFLLFLLRCVFHFQIVKSQFGHHVGINYMFTPWISWLILLKSSPVISPKDVSYQILCWFFITPILVLDVKIYGQWFTTEKRFLSVVANPTSQLSVIGNLVGAWTAADMGWTESGVCLFTLGIIHYFVVFITLYQRLSGSKSLPARLRPLLFLFVAAPSMASLAWSSISGCFGTPSKMLFFLSLFLFITLACRPALFKTSMKKFSIAWWTYSFPLTFLTLASAEYAQQVKGAAPSGLFATLSLLSELVFLCLIVYTALNVGILFRDVDPFDPLLS